MSVDKYFNDLNTPMKEIALELRKIIKDISSEIKEELKWNSPTYALNRNFCSIMSHKSHVNLQIFQGANIKAANQLEGTGKNMRHLKFTSLADINKNEIRRCIQQAVEFENEHA